MPRPYIGLKPYMVRITPLQHSKVKRLAELRGKTVHQTHRDIIDVGTERLESCLRLSKQS